MEDAQNLEKNHNCISSIEFTLAQSHENHPQIKKVTENIDNIKTEKDKNELADKLIKFNLDEPLLFHVKNLANNNINLSRIKIKNKLQLFREEVYPKDDEYLDNIDSIKINLGDDEDLQNLNFCHYKIQFYNPKIKKIDRLVIFTTIFQLKILAEAKELFVDGTFKVAPQKYYQLLNVWG